MRVDLYTSAFCAPCAQTRRVVADAAALVPAAEVTEYDVVRFEDRAAAEHIRSTPTLIVRDTAGTTVFRAEGAPTLNQLLVALAKAV